MTWLAPALVLLPGLLVVRAPWTAVAPLSLAYWVLSAWWPPFAFPGRSRLLAGVLLAALVLALLRLLPRHDVGPPPGWRPPPQAPPRVRPARPTPPLASAASLVILAAACGLLLPLPLWHHAPGPRLAFQTTTARLLVWRDGIPTSLEPLLPLAPAGAHAPALATLAADLSHLAGLDPARALVVVVVAAAGLLLVGLFALDAAWAPPRAAAAGALLALAVSPWPGLLSLWGEGEALLALAFLLPAAALLAGHVSRSSAVAAAFLIAAGSLAQPLLALLALALAAVVVLSRRGPPRAAWSRILACAALALAFAAPGLWPLARALSVREALALAAVDRWRELPSFVLGFLLSALAPLAFVGVAESRSRTTRAALAGAAALTALLLVVRVHGWIAAGQIGEGLRRALAHAAQATGPLATICAGETVRDLVPALAGRGAGEPGVWIPTVYADEWTRADPRPCAIELDDLLPPPPPP
jgi:hypothetical protein